jgi:DNA-binding NtrC family response regulator
MVKWRILLVDDDEFILKSFAPALEGEGYEVATADTGEKAMDIIEKDAFDLIISDLILDEIDGIMILKKAKQINPESAVIILTGYGDMTSAIDALRLGADDYLLKPCETEEIFFRVRRALEKLTLQRKIRIYEKTLPVCCICKKIRDDADLEHGVAKWLKMEDYLHDKAKVAVTSTYCPDCIDVVMKEIKDVKESD